MRVLFTCADRPTISRNLFHRKILKERFEYDEVVSGGKSYASRIPSIFARLPLHFFGKDFYFVSYMGHFLVPIIRLFTNKPIVFDFYLSIYDVMCNDRKLYSPDSLLGRFTYSMEKSSLQKADYIIVDTNRLISTLSDEYGVDRDKFIKVPLTINEDNVKKISVDRYRESFTVLYVGSYIPLHGVEVVIEAAKILQDMGEDIYFLMIGEGPEYQKCVELVEKYHLTNVEFKGFMTLEELNHYYNSTDINLGLFSVGERANSVVLNKTNDSFRVGKPHLTLETDAMREAFEDNRDIFFVKDNSPQTLAERIVEISRNPKLLKEVGDNALISYDEKLSNAKAKEILDSQIFDKIESLN
ncbi:Glycosyl transferase, group 1 [hydrothermal vent metagenome]|uniref:Glycosyl transferase, group 1 n=1 Tax=hydrothermal vent metagenome TaxID=652676 RepID=A0A1W1CB79_9ZZZZ